MALDPQLIADLTALGGAGVAVTEVGRGARPVGGPGVIHIGVARGATVDDGLDAFDVLLTDLAPPLAPWVGVADVDAAVAELTSQIEAQPVAAAVAAQVLRMTLSLSFDQALALESLAYSMLLASNGFRAWRATNPPRQRPDDGAPRTRIDDAGGRLGIRLTRPAARNAFDAHMRDELTEALTFALDHPDRPPVELSGEGPAFSAGGDLDEFGRAADVGFAHLIRTVRSPARLAHQLGGRLSVRVHGACVGAGIEVPAAAGRVAARPDAIFRLPEVSMGLIPGAGGTASIPRRIGRHRAAYLALSNADIDAPTALAWGLIDAIEGA